MQRPRARRDQKRQEDRAFHHAHNDRMSQFSAELLQAAARERAVQLTTNGRKTGKPRRVTIWIGTDGKRLYIRSGEGMRRHWPQNMLAKAWCGSAKPKSKSSLGSSPIRPKPARCPGSTEASTARSCGPPSPASRSRLANRQTSSSYLAETNRPGEGGPLRGPALQGRGRYRVNAS